MKPLPVDVHWVSTKYELADPYTRGVPLPEVPCATQGLSLYDAAVKNFELRTLGQAATPNVCLRGIGHLPPMSSKR